MAIQIISGPTIAAGQSLSTAINVTMPNVSIAHVYFPAEWDGEALLTFQASPDGVTFSDVYTKDGGLLTVRCIPGGMINVETQIWRAAYFKFRSGHPPVGNVQHEARTFTCVLDSGASM